MIHKKNICFKIRVCFLLIFCVSSIFPSWADADTKGVKTSYKRYTIVKYKNENILCEPYIVKEGDWVYKIFRKKGELSKANFSFFLMLFSEINSQIRNLDAITPGTRILIPLKKAGQTEYDQTTTGNIDVPVIEFSALQDELNLTSFMKKHRVKKGETISSLLDKDFLNKGGGISKQGLEALHLLNPNIKNIHMIYQGSDIYLPLPRIRSQPWFKRIVSGEPLNKKDKQPGIEKNKPAEEQFKIHASQLVLLKKYASLINGTLFYQGKMIFPAENNSSNVIDLSSTPVIETQDGSKMLILSDNNVGDALLKNMQAHWKNMKTQLISEIINTAEKGSQVSSPEKTDGPAKLEKIVETLLLQANYTYIPDSKIPFTIHHLPLEASFGRVILKDRDILINFGRVYGSALTLLAEQGFKILTIPPDCPPLEMIEKLFSHLGYATWKNPSLSGKKNIIRLNGLYAAKGQDKLFIPITHLNKDTSDYLNEEEIKILSMKNNIQTQ